MTRGTSTPEDPDRLEALIRDYFLAGAERERATLANAIEEAAEGSIERVAQAVRSVDLWGPMVPAEGEFTVETRSARRVEVSWRALGERDLRSARGLILVMPLANETGNPDLAHSRAIAALGPAFRSNGFVAALDKPIAGEFHQHPAAGDDLRTVVRELRRQLHLDTDRVFLFGYREGGEGTWIAAMFHSDLFAGVIPVASRPRLPYPEQLTPMLLANLRNLPVLGIWESDAGDTPSDEVLATAVFNRAIVLFAQQNGLPLRGSETIFATTPIGRLPDPALLDAGLRAFAENRRASPGRKVGRWFRYPAQGDLGWVRATKLHGDVWTDDQASIVASAESDRDEFITDFFEEKLFHLSAQVAGQTVTIETKGIAKLEVLFYEGMLDYKQPVTVLCNGRKRFQGLVKPSIATMLEKAYEDWEFQRLVHSSMPFSIRPDGAGE